jgi:hypothetical protein
MSDFGWVPRCAVCRNSVNLTVSKTDEHGRAVHEKCYVWSLLSKKPPSDDGPVPTRRSYLGGPLLG